MSDHKPASALQKTIQSTSIIIASLTVLLGIHPNCHKADLEATDEERYLVSKGLEFMPL